MGVFIITIPPNFYKAFFRDIPPPKLQTFPGFWCFDAAEGSHGSRIHFVKNFGNSMLVPGSRLKTTDSPDPIVRVELEGLSWPIGEIEKVAGPPN